MQTRSSSSRSAFVSHRSQISVLSHLLNYPEVVDEKADAFNFFVDGHVIQTVGKADGIMLRFDLPCSESVLVDFAGYAAGRFLRDEATLAWDTGRSMVFLWQTIPSDADAGQMVGSFERFLDACDWWLSRCTEKEVPPSVFPDILIRP